MGLETAAIIGIAAAAASSTASVYGATKTSGAAQDAAKLQADAATHAAELQAKANADTLAFTKQAAENQYQNTEAARRASYNVSAKQAGFVGSVGDLMGLPPMTIPDYVPGVDPKFTGPSGNTGPASGTPGPTAAPGGPNGPLTDPNAWMGLVGNPEALRQWVQQGLGPKGDPELVSYYVGKIQGQPGANPQEQAGSAAYWLNKMQTDPKITGQAAAAPIGTVGSYLTTPSVYAPPLRTPPLQPPLSPYAVGAYL